MVVVFEVFRSCWYVGLEFGSHGFVFCGVGLRGSNSNGHYKQAGSRLVGDFRNTQTPPGGSYDNPALYWWFFVIMQSIKSNDVFWYLPCRNIILDGDIVLNGCLWRENVRSVCRRPKYCNAACVFAPSLPAVIACHWCLFVWWLSIVCFADGFCFDTYVTPVSTQHTYPHRTRPSSRPQTGTTNNE